MNRKNLRLLGGAAALGMSALSHAQYTGWVGLCDDPSTTSSNYSTDYVGLAVGNDLWGAGLPVAGTARYELCYQPGGFTAQARGGLEFFTGRLGSLHSDDDNYLDLIEGGSFYSDGGNPERFGAGNGSADWTYACILRQKDTDANPTLTRIGQSAVTGYFVGASDRYMIATFAESNTDIEWRVDVIGDAARVQWTLTNTDAAAINLGMWFGQVVDPIPNYNYFSPPSGVGFINIPGYKPLTVARRFMRNPDLSATAPRQFPLPEYVDFATGQTDAWAALRVINTQSPTDDGPYPDQTNVDGFDIAQWHLLLGDQPANNGKMPDVVHEDFALSPWPAYIQKWNVTPVGGTDQQLDARRRQIVAYYKSSWGDSNFSKPYNVVADSPKVIGVQDSNPFQFIRSPSTLRVYIDNTRGFSTVDTEVQLENVEVTLNLPQGLAAAGNPNQRTITKIISRIDPKTIKFADFNIAADPTAFGIKDFTVTIQPQPGPTKVITGQITVASQPYLQITDSSNLVAAPWKFGAGDWATILGGPNGLKPDIDYQAFDWDAQSQQYVISTGPNRGASTWIVSTKNVGFKALQGNPTTPQDLGTGAPLVDLKAGWNLIGNPYNYPIPLGQLVGVPGSDNRNSYTYQELLNRGALTSAFAFWDQGTDSYKFIGDVTDMLLPNTGYWVNVLDAQGLTLSYPAVYTPFLPAGAGGLGNDFVAKSNKVLKRDALWSLNLVAKQGRQLDDENTLGFAAPGTSPVKSRVYEPPMSPSKRAISAAFEVDTKKGMIRLANNLLSDGDLRIYNFGVYTKAAGPVKVTWPDMKYVPGKYALTLRDTVTGAKIDMRSTDSYTFQGGQRSDRVLKISVTVGAGPLLDSLTVDRAGGGNSDPAIFSYYVSGPVTTTVRILQNGSPIRVLTKNEKQTEGTQSTSWNLKVAGNKVPAGTYQAEVTVTDGTKSEAKTVTFKVK